MATAATQGKSSSADDDNLRRSLDHLHSHSAAVSSLLLQWRDLDSLLDSIDAALACRLSDLDYRDLVLHRRLEALEAEENRLNFLKKALDDRFLELGSEERRYTQTAPSPFASKVKPEPVDEDEFLQTLPAVPNHPPQQPPPSSSSAPTIRFCVTMDGKRLQMFLNERENQHERMRARGEISTALKMSSDPAKLVLDAMEGFYRDYNKKGEDLMTIRKSCILLLQELMKISAPIGPRAREEAAQLAQQWKRKMSLKHKKGRDWKDVWGFLQLVATYKLVPDYNGEELRKLCNNIGKKGNDPALRAALGIVDERWPGNSKLGRASGAPVGPKTQPDLVSLCTNMDERGLRLFLNKHAEQHDSMCSEIYNALQCAPDPAKLIMDVLNGYHLRSLSILQGFDPVINKKSCIVLLRQLVRMSPRIETSVKVEATKFAGNLKAEFIRKKDIEKILVFLFVVSAYQLTPSLRLSSSEFFGLMKCVVYLPQTPYDSRSLAMIMQRFLNENLNEQETMRDDVCAVLLVAKDPAKLVLDAMEGFYGGKGDLSAVRKSCLLLLKQLMKVSPSVSHSVRDEAVQVAHQWETNINFKGGDSFEVVCFLQLVEAYGLASYFYLQSVDKGSVQRSSQAHIMQLEREKVNRKRPAQSPVSALDSQLLEQGGSKLLRIDESAKAAASTSTKSSNIHPNHPSGSPAASSNLQFQEQNGSKLLQRDDTAQAAPSASGINSNSHLMGPRFQHPASMSINQGESNSMTSANYEGSMGQNQQLHTAEVACSSPRAKTVLAALPPNYLANLGAVLGGIPGKTTESPNQNLSVVEHADAGDITSTLHSAPDTVSATANYGSYVACNENGDLYPQMAYAASGSSGGVASVVQPTTNATPDAKLYDSDTIDSMKHCQNQQLHMAGLNYAGNVTSVVQLASNTCSTSVQCDSGTAGYESTHQNKQHSQLRRYACAGGSTSFSTSIAASSAVQDGSRTSEYAGTSETWHSLKAEHAYAVPCTSGGVLSTIEQVCRGASHLDSTHLNASDRPYGLDGLAYLPAATSSAAVPFVSSSPANLSNVQGKFTHNAVGGSVVTDPSTSASITSALHSMQPSSQHPAAAPSQHQVDLTPPKPPQPISAPPLPPGPPPRGLAPPLPSHSLAPPSPPSRGLPPPSSQHPGGLWPGQQAHHSVRCSGNYSLGGSAFTNPHLNSIGRPYGLGGSPSVAMPSCPPPEHYVYDSVAQVPARQFSFAGNSSGPSNMFHARYGVPRPDMGPPRPDPTFTFYPYNAHPRPSFQPQYHPPFYR